MSIYIPPVPRAPTYHVPGRQPVTVEVSATSDRDLVFETQIADAIVVFAPDAGPVPPAGRELGDYLARINAKGFDPDQADRSIEIWIPKLCYLRQVVEEDEHRFVLAGFHAFTDLCGLAALVVVLAPEARDYATIQAPLDPRRLF
jgi:hypothetical protein